MNPIRPFAAPRAAGLLAAFALAAASTSAHAFPFYESPTFAVSEYVNDITGHYVLLTDSFEMSLVESGRAGPGWRPTRYHFTAYTIVQGGSRPEVCRFYGPSPNSHFFTADARECAILKQPGSGWLFEGTRFKVDLPVGGACPAQTAPVYRLYNNRWMFNDSNHRFAPDPAIRDEMKAAGWIDEGIAFCADSWGIAPVASLSFDGKAIRPLPQCEDETISQGGCVGLNNVPFPTQRIKPYLPPWWIEHNPLYSPSFTALTGKLFDVMTAQSPSNTAAVAAHSFLQAPDYGGGEWGFHVSGLDRGTSDYIGIDAMQQLRTTAPVQGMPDERLFPWRAGRHQRMELAFRLTARTARPVDARGHAYGGPMLAFRDVAGGRSFFVTLQAFGTVPPGDFAGRDVATGNVIVSTVFRERPAFGSRLAGDFVACPAGSCAAQDRAEYRFRIERADFEAILRSARAVEPALSARPEDYALASFRFRGEVFGDARLGFTLGQYGLEVYNY